METIPPECPVLSASYTEVVHEETFPTFIYVGSSNLTDVFEDTVTNTYRNPNFDLNKYMNDVISQHHCTFTSNDNWPESLTHYIVLEE